MELVELLAQIDNLKTEIDQLRPIDREQEQRILQKFRLDWNYHSNAIGQYKSASNSVRTSTGEMHYYASPHETPAMMGDLMQWYRTAWEKQELHPLLLAATFHLRLVAIHPFDDGNGRMARLLMNLILLQAGYVPVIIHSPYVSTPEPKSLAQVIYAHNYTYDRNLRKGWLRKVIIHTESLRSYKQRLRERKLP